MNSETPIDPLSSATAHADLGAPTSGSSMAKRIVLRLTRFFVEPQRAYNRGIVDAVQLLREGERRLGHRITLEGQEHDAATAGVRTELTGLQLALADRDITSSLTRGQVVELAQALQRLEARVAGLDAELANVRAELDARRRHDRAQDSLVGLFLREVRRQYPAPPDLARLHQLPHPDDELDQALDHAFAGSFDDVRALRSAYLPDVEPLAAHGRVLDVRPGRGEWLEVLKQAGIAAYGVDPSPAVVAACADRGLEVAHAGVFEHLASVPDATLAAVTGFHVAERLGFGGLVELVDHAARVLRPGGVLILETPNPTNLLVGAAPRSNPGAGRPIHPDVLDFVVSARGFADVELRFLHPDPAPLEWSPEARFPMKPLEPVVERLNELLFGPRDVAVVGRRVDD